MKKVFCPIILLLAGQVSQTDAQTKLEQDRKTKAITKFLENSLKI
jgi:hypothetical protein